MSILSFSSLLNLASFHRACLSTFSTSLTCKLMTLMVLDGMISSSAISLASRFLALILPWFTSWVYSQRTPTICCSSSSLMFRGCSYQRRLGLRYSSELVLGLQTVANRKMSLDSSTIFSQFQGILSEKGFTSLRWSITAFMLPKLAKCFTDFLMPIPLMEVLQSVPDRTAASTLRVWSIFRNSLRKKESASKGCQRDRSTQLQSPSCASFITTLIPQTIRSESSEMARSTSPRWKSLAIWLSDSQGATMKSTPLPRKARMVVVMILSSMMMQRDRYFLASSSLPILRYSSPRWRFSSLVFLRLSMVSSFLPTQRPSKTQTGVMRQCSSRSSISKMQQRKLLDSIFWLSSKAQRQHPLQIHDITSIAALLPWKVLRCSRSVTCSSSFSRPSIPIPALSYNLAHTSALNANSPFHPQHLPAHHPLSPHSPHPPFPPFPTTHPLTGLR